MLPAPAAVQHNHRSMSRRDETRVVYSTATDGKCPVCGWPQRSCMCSRQKRPAAGAVPDKIVARLRMEKAGRGGKTVTVVYDLPRNEAFLKDLAQKLKRECGTGGTFTEDRVELQGEMRDRVRGILQRLGYTVKG